jgi:hypothetical protein
MSTPPCNAQQWIGSLASFLLGHFGGGSSGRGGGSSLSALAALVCRCSSGGSISIDEMAEKRSLLQKILKALSTIGNLDVSNAAAHVGTRTDCASISLFCSERSSS